MIRRGPLLAAILLLGSAVPAARGGEPDDPIWKRLADPKDPDHANAVEAWSRLSETMRSDRVRAALASTNPAVVRFAAEVADVFTLDLAELRKAAAICAADPAWVASPQRELTEGIKSEGIGFGIPDLVSMWRTATTTDGFAFVVNSKGEGPGDEYHRAANASLAKDLVPLLETKNDAVRVDLAGDLDLVANVTTRDETRPAFAKGFLYLLARKGAVKAGKPLPTFASIEAKIDGPGVPDALKTLVRAALEDDEELMAVAPLAASRKGPFPWLVRWARDTIPTAEDLPFLQEVEKGAEGFARLPPLRAWAIRALAALDPKGERSDWRQRAEGDDEVAAAELARQGKPERLRAMADVEGKASEVARILSWDVDSERARTRYLESIDKAEVPSEVVDLSPFERADYEIEWGVKIRDADLRAIGQALSEGETPRRGCAWFYAHAIPEGITPEVARAMAKRLRATADDLRSGSELDHGDLKVTLAMLEARAPDVLRELLHAWAEGPAGDKREEALVTLARLGDAKFLEPMIQAWASEDGWDIDALLLGRVKDPRVGRFLRARLEGDKPENTREELAALAVYEGLPEDYRWLLSPGKDDKEPEPYATVRARLVAGDVRSAVLALVQHGLGIDSLWQVKIPEALEALRRIRRERFAAGYASYWPATKALAAAGDADARREWLGFLRDGRVRMNDGHDITLPGVLATDPELLEAMISLLDSNCCLGWQAYAGLHHSYPTAPMDNIGPYLARNRVAAERWFAEHRGTFVWSRILDGYVPGPSKR